MDWDVELGKRHSSDLSKPLHVILRDNDDKKLKDWLNGTLADLIDGQKERTQEQRANLRRYRGQPEFSYKEKWDSKDKSNKLKKLIINHLHDLTEVKVSLMTRFKPAVEVLPTHDEWEDRASSRVVNSLIKHLWYINNIDSLAIDQQRWARIFGESYIFVTWDKDKGDLDPAYVAAKEMGLSTVQDEDGNAIDLEKPIKTGDVSYEIELPWRVVLQKKESYAKTEYLFRICIVPTEDLKDEYPDMKEEIKPDDELEVFDTESGLDKPLEHHTVVVHMYHKKTKQMPNGAHIVFTKDAVLFKEDLPFSHGKLPVIRLTDLDIPTEQHGISKYEMLVPIQTMYDNLSTLIAKNIWLMAHAKWLVPHGSCKIEQLGNDNTVVSFKGPIPPQLANTQSNPPEVYAYRQELKQEMQIIMGSHGISRGAIPKGITAASALQFLNELENERSTTDIAKHAFMIKELALMSISVAGDNYKPDDGRLMRIVGKNNQYMIKSFDKAHLNKDYDVRIDLSTGLPETKSAKIERTLEAMARNPQMFSPERWEEMLELGAEEKRISLATSALRLADSENEDMLSGADVPDPERWEDHIGHWESHTSFMQSRAFKEAPPEERAKMESHVKITEVAMLEKAKMSPTFAAQLANLKLFPLYYHEDFVAPASAEHQAALVQGQANSGNPVSGQIPGKVKEDLSIKEETNA